MVSRPGDLHNFQMEYHGFLSCLEFGIGQFNEMREREKESREREKWGRVINE